MGFPILMFAYVLLGSLMKGSFTCSFSLAFKGSCFESQSSGA